MTTIPGLDRMLGDRIRTAINDPSCYTDRRGTAENHDVELRSDWTVRAVVLAIERGLFENDCRLVPGKTLFELEQRAGQAHAPIPGPHSAADSPTAPPEGSDGVETPNGTHRCDERNDAGLLAFIVRDLMHAADYTYSPDRPLHQQARECCAAIRGDRHRNGELELAIQKFDEHHEREQQRLQDLADELRKQLEAALRVAEHPPVVAWRRTAAEIPTPDEWNALVRERDDVRAELAGMRKIVMDKDEELEDQSARVANLDRLLQERDTHLEQHQADLEARDFEIDRLLGELRKIRRRNPDPGPDLGDDPDGDLDGADYPPFPARSRP